MFGTDKYGKDTLAGQFGSGGPEALPPDVEMQFAIDGWLGYLKAHTPIDKIRGQLENLGLPLNDGTVSHFLLEKARQLASRGREEMAGIASRAAILRTKH